MFFESLPFVCKRLSLLHLSLVSFFCSGRDAAESVDPATEVVLDDDIAALGRTYTHGPFKTILLTGATGFLGAFLLRELLDTHQTATVSKSMNDRV